jgi:hypothetical protein
MALREVGRGVIAAIQTFGDRINLHVHLHFLVTEGGVDEAGVFHKIPRIDDSRLAKIFAREVLAMLIRKELLSPEWAERVLSWPHSGFNVHSHIFIARVTSHIPDKGQVMVRYYGLYANAHRGKAKKASLSPTASVCTHGDRRCLHECVGAPGGRGKRGIFLKRISCPDTLFERQSLWLFVVIDSAVQPAIYFQHS